MLTYDPPTGWRYGFPKPYQPLPGETLADTLVRDGYPRVMAENFGADHCRFMGSDRELDALVFNPNTAARQHVEHFPDDLATTTFGPLHMYGVHEEVATKPTAYRGIPLPSGVSVTSPDNDNLRHVAATATERKGDWMQTFTGRQFWPLDARKEEVYIEDIAHSLSLQCRYAGHCLRFYSVAEHCVHIAQWLSEMGESTETAIAGLLHDATEAYLVDVPRPVKRSMNEYKLHEVALWKVIAARYDLPEVLPDVVHEADGRIIADELANMHPMDWHAKHDDPLRVKLQYWSPAEAERAFLETFQGLMRNRQQQAMVA